MGEMGEGGQEVHIFSYKISQNAMYNMTLINNIVLNI